MDSLEVCNSEYAMIIGLHDKIIGPQRLPLALPAGPEDVRMRRRSIIPVIIVCA